MVPIRIFRATERCVSSLYAESICWILAPFSHPPLTHTHKNTPKDFYRDEDKKKEEGEDQQQQQQ